MATHAKEHVPPAGTSDRRLVSVVIPCYNQARYLGDAITSVLEQAHQEREILVVDDGSRDGTRQVADSFPQVRYIHQKNQGTASARNHGFRESRGAYILFLDADDRLLPRALAVGVQSLEDHPSCGFAYGHVRVIRPDGSLLTTPPQTPVEADHYLRLLRDNYIWTPGVVLYRRGAFESVHGFEKGAGGSADLDLNLRISRIWPVWCHGEIVLEYREHDASQSANAAEMLRSTIRARRKQRTFLGGRPEYEVAFRDGIRKDQAYYGTRLVDSAARHLRGGRRRRALFELLTLVRYDPRRFVTEALRKFI